MPSSIAARRWVVNASPLILLSKVGEVRLLGVLAQDLVIPAAVVSELEGGSADDSARRAIEQLPGARIVAVDDIDARVERWDLGAGESAVLTFALHNPAFEAVVDDRAARNCAAALQLPTRGTLGLLLLAKREGQLASVGPVIASLRNAGMYLEPTLEHAVLKLADED